MSDEEAAMAHAEWVNGQLEDEIDLLRDRINSLVPKVNYIATYQAQCSDGNTVTANLSLQGVTKGADPASIIQLVTDLAYEDIARSGMNASKVLVINLSRVW